MKRCSWTTPVIECDAIRVTHLVLAICVAQVYVRRGDSVCAGSVFMEAQVANLYIYTLHAISDNLHIYMSV
jgi:hypothetical protein